MELMPQGWKRVVPYLVYDIDKGLSIAPLETIYHIGHFPNREDCLDKGGEFILGDDAADQALQGLTTEIEDDRWIRGRVRIPRRIKTR